MAGAGYKLFNTGDVLTAAQVNTYLQEQTVMVFASSTARTTALSGVLAEGMVSYLQDTNAVEVYNGSAWVAIAADQTPLTTKGDLFTFSTVDARLAVGTNGQYLKADSTAATGLAWATLPASGKVLQVVQASTTTETANTTSTYADSTLTASITPSLATSKVLVLVTQQGVSRNSGSNECILNVRIVRGATTIHTQNRANHALGGTGLWLSTMVAMAYLDSPNTTSSTTYKTQFAIGAVGSHTYVQYDSSPSTITLLEIGA